MGLFEIILKRSFKDAEQNRHAYMRLHTILIKLNVKVNILDKYIGGEIKYGE